MQTKDLTNYFLSQDSKKQLIGLFFKNCHDTNKQNFENYKFALRYTMLFNGCICNYGSLSSSFKRQCRQQNYFSGYIWKLIGIFKILEKDPHSFIFSSQSTKQIRDASFSDYPKVKKILYQKQFNFSQRQNIIDQVVLQLLTVNLSKCFQQYNKQYVNQIISQYHQLFQKESRIDHKKYTRYNKLPDHQIIQHGIKLNILTTIIQDLIQTSSKFVQLSLLFCKPIGQRYAPIVGYQMVNYLKENPNLKTSEKKDKSIVKIQAQYPVNRAIIFDLEVQIPKSPENQSKYDDQLQRSEQYQYYKRKARQNIQRKKIYKR